MQDAKFDLHSTVDLDGRPDEPGFRRSLYIIIFEAETKLGKIFDIILLFAILLSVLEVTLGSDPMFSKYLAPYSYTIEWVLTIFFTIEYSLRLYVSKKPKRYALSFFGVVDLISILPTYLSLILPGTQYLMTVRVLRLLRVFRILKLVRYNDAAYTLIQSLKASRYKIFIFLEAILALVLIMGTCMYIVEGEQSGFSSIPKSMYWTIVTMTTVGYGDIVPTTGLGKFVASIMMLIGYAIIAVPTGIVSSEMGNVQRKLDSLNAKKTSCPRCQTECLKEQNYCHMCSQKLR